MSEGEIGERRCTGRGGLLARFPTGAGMAIATLTDLTYWYPGRDEAALKNVRLAVEGGLTVIAGPSGGGKSTLLRAFNGLVPHFHAGRIPRSAEVMELEVIATPTRKRAPDLAFSCQDP